jgi:hypothetical protein
MFGTNSGISEKGYASKKEEEDEDSEAGSKT